MRPMQPLPIKTLKDYEPAQQINIKTKKQLHQYLHRVIKNKDYTLALHLLDYLVDKEPQNPHHYSNRGLIYYRCQQWTQALNNYNQALRLKPNGDRIYANRAKCHAAIGHWHNAIADYDCAININPYNIKARLHQGILFRDLRMYDEAIVCFGLALFLGSLKADIYAERGRTYHLDGHWNCALGDYRQALAILHQSPQKPLSYQVQAWISELLN